MASDQIVYREWQYPRVSSFLPLLLFVPAVWIVAAPFGTPIGIYIGAAFAAIGIALKLTSAKFISVDGKSLHLGTAAIPRKVIGKISKIEKNEQFLARGAQLDARAFVFLKYGLPEMIRIEIADPKDPTPYLLISTRNADELIKALG